MKIVLAVFTLLILYLNTNAQERSNEAWLEDLKAYQTGLEGKHIDMYNKISKKEFEKELAKIEASSGKKTDIEITLDLMRLTRKIGDGHTAISVRNLGFHYYPFEVQNFDGEWRIIKVAAEYSHLLGQKLTGIENEHIEAVIKKVGEVAQFVENKQSLIVRTGENLTCGEMLYGLKISAEKTRATFTFSNDFGETTSLKLTALTRPELDEASASAKLEIGIPEVRRPETATSKYFWYTPITGTDGLYIHFESYPSFEDMMKVAEEMVAYIFQNNIRQLVIDLRNNGGGDLYVGLVLANALNLADPVDWKNGVYVLADNVTFSAAASNTALFRELLNAKIVGEPTGSNPTGYQDMDTFELPNSKLIVCYSKRLFRIQETASPGVQPDVLLNYDWASFSKGRDSMLEWVINEIK